MKRLNCTVFDKRGVNNDCMEFNPKGKYLRYSEANNRIKELVSKCSKQHSRIAEIESLLEHISKDLIMRAELDTDGFKVVNLSSSVWMQIKKALKVGINNGG
jgi:hypothetical protein